MKVFITGAGGFIGSHVAEAAVRAGHKVRCLVRYNSRSSEGLLENLSREIYRELEVVSSDVCDGEAMRAHVAGMEGVLHLAALIGIPYSYVAPSSYVSVNVQGTVNVLNAARAASCGVVVQTSTSEVYGSAQYTPMDEAHPLVAQSPYSASKIAADKIAESYARSFAVPVVILRPFNTFGPRQSLRAVIPSLASQLLDDRVNEVRAGTLSTVRDFTFVTDTADGFLRALNAAVPTGEVINLGTGTGYAITDVYEKLQELSGMSKPLQSDAHRTRPEASEVSRLISNNQKAKAMLGWAPSVNLEQGLDRVISHMRSSMPHDTSRYHV